MIVDDDPVQRRLLETAITRSGMQRRHRAGRPARAGPAIHRPKGEQITLMLLDLVMPDMGGMEVLTKLRAANPDLPVIVLTAKGGIDSAVEAMRAGANDFLVKPASPERIAVSIRNQLKIGTLSGEVKRLKKKQQQPLTFDDLIADIAGNEAGLPPGHARRAIRHPDPDRRRKRRRQGTDRPRHPGHLATAPASPSSPSIAAPSRRT